MIAYIRREYILGAVGHEAVVQPNLYSPAAIIDRICIKPITRTICRPLSTMQQLQLSIENAPLITQQEIDDIFQGKIVRKLNVPDLPPELWMDILSYLPRGFVRKMIGINRFLFELGMRELYEEVRLLDYDNFGLKTFEQIG